MERLEELIQECVEFVVPAFKDLITKTGNLLAEPLDAAAFSSELLHFQWPPLLNSDFQNLDTDTLVNFTLRRVVTDLLLTENENDLDNLSTNKDGIDAAAVALDFCFHSRTHRKDPSMWSNSFFTLFSTVIDVLSWPNALLDFWPYAESRTDWFKMCKSLDVLPPGMSNLISYKQPLYDKLRHWNDLLKTVQNNAYLNTPLHYKMKYKLEKFLSELLPINEESNFNRSALFSNKQSSGNPWNKTISSATRTDSSSENIFATDYNYLFDNLLTCPLEFIYKPLEFKMDLDSLLTPLLDAIFEIEEGFYKQIKTSRKNVRDINEKLNPDFPFDFELMPAKVPTFVRTSERIQRERASYWNDFLRVDESLDSVPRPTLLDISISNPSVLYEQMMEPENDCYRKQFLLQLCFAITLVRQIITSPEIESYYKGSYQKERPSRSLNFDSLNEPNYKKTVALCDHLLINRINKFYHYRDPHFASIIRKLSNADHSFLKAKIDGFKAFHNFIIPDGNREVTPVDYSFKKFGFIPLGNKSINNVWKIKTGLDLVDKHPKTAQELYGELYDRWSLGKNNQRAAEGESDDKIVKEWQILRSLRSQYLFNFSQVTEDVGISGLFDPNLIKLHAGEKKRSLEGMLEKVKEPHLIKLAAARSFNTERSNRKRALEQETEQPSTKKIKPNGDNSSTEALLSKEIGEPVKELYEETLVQPEGEENAATTTSSQSQEVINEKENSLTPRSDLEGSNAPSESYQSVPTSSLPS